MRADKMLQLLDAIARNEGNHEVYKNQWVSLEEVEDECLLNPRTFTTMKKEALDLFYIALEKDKIKLTTVGVWAWNNKNLPGFK